jgi:drug/metabolite transporter (DMT)-like permease
MTAFVYILLCLLWGSTWIAIKIGLSQAPPLYTAAMRFMLAVIILAGLTRIKRRPYPSGLRTILRVAYPGVYMFGASYALVYIAELYIDSGLTAVLFGAFPFFVAALSHWRLPGERLKPFAWLGLLVGFAGVVIISRYQWQLSGDLFLGTMLALAAAFSSAHGVVIHKKHHMRHEMVPVLVIQMIAGGLPLLAGAIMFESLSDFVVGPESIGSVLYLAIFGTVVTFLGYFWLLRQASVVAVSLIAFVTPAVAVLIGVLFFGEVFSVSIALGTALILSGIVMVVGKPKAPAGHGS